MGNHLVLPAFGERQDSHRGHNEADRFETCPYLAKTINLDSGFRRNDN
ncbi:MAG: hypothetical protein JW967_08550 [Dehalococcoidales bacterium]|nr:hypothetical protein [Dehalococcoidales bacterium]